MTDATTSDPGMASTEGKVRKAKIKKTAEGAEATATEAKEEKEAKPKRERRARFPEEHVITIMVPNPKSGKCRDRFDQYRTGMTIKEYVEVMNKEPFNYPVGQIWGDIWWDSDPKRNLIHVGPTTVDVPPPPPPKEKKPKKTKKAEAEAEAASEQPAA